MVADVTTTVSFMLSNLLFEAKVEFVLAKIVDDIPIVEGLSEALANTLLVKWPVAKVLFVAMAIELEGAIREFSS